MWIVSSEETIHFFSSKIGYTVTTATWIGYGTPTWLAVGVVYCGASHWCHKGHVGSVSVGVVYVSLTLRADVFGVSEAENNGICNVLCHWYQKTWYLQCFETSPSKNRRIWRDFQHVARSTCSACMIYAKDHESIAIYEVLLPDLRKHLIYYILCSSPGQNTKSG